MAGRPWTPEEEEIVRAGHKEGKQPAEIADSLPPDRNENAVRQKGSRLCGPWNTRPVLIPTLTRVVSETPERVVIAPVEAASEEMEAVWARSLLRTDRKLAKAKTEGLAVVRIMTDKPIAFSISSDWHVTSRGATDLRGLREYSEAIRDTPGAYAVAVGDLYDNPVKWSKNMGDVPDELMLIAVLFQSFGYKLLGTTSGNHDDWTAAVSGIDALRWLAERDRIHYAPDELVYLVELVDPRTQETTARYCIATRHKYYRHSNLNPTHSCFRWLEDRVGQWPETEDGAEIVPDVLAIGHNHVACCEERSMRNKSIWGARMGPWQYTTGFGRAGGWKNSPPTAPTFILHPHRERPIEGHADYRTALESLTRHRQDHAA